MQLLSVFDTVFNGVMTIPTALTIAALGFVLVMIVLCILALIVLVMGKVFDAVFGKKPKNNKNENVKTAPAQTVKPVKAVVPEVTLIGVEEQDAAVIMAIVSNKSGIPLNRLKFNSIRLVEDK